MLEIGIKGNKKVIVDDTNTAEVYGSGDLPVFATPAMIGLMEFTASASVSSYLEEGQSTVGTVVNVKHVAATPVGMEVHCESELVEIDRITGNTDGQIRICLRILICLHQRLAI